MTQTQDKFRRVLGGFSKVRGVLTTLGIRTTRVLVVVRKWPGGRRSADGGFVDYSIYQGKVLAQATGMQLVTTGIGMEILPRPKVRFISTREIFNSGGIYQQGDLRVTYIQPYWSDHKGVQHGYTMSDIAPDPDSHDGAEVFYRLVGDTFNSEYYRVGTVTEKFGHYELVLTARRTTPTKDGL